MYHPEFLTPGTFELFWSSKADMTEDKNGALFTNFWSGIYSWIQLFIQWFVHNKSLGQLLHVSSNHFIYWKTFNSQ